MGLGPLHVVSLAEARDAAHEARRLLRQGLDPIKQRRSRQQQAAAASTTFRVVAEDFHASQAGKWRSSNHRQGWLFTMRSYVFPQLGELPVATVDTAAVIAVLKPLWSTKYETGRRVRQRIEAVLDRAAAMGLRTGDNPARWSGHLEHLLPARDRTQVPHHHALPWRQIPDLMARLRQREPDVLGIDALALEFLILTAARMGEVLYARWDEIEGDTWVIPAARMKGGSEHRVPLSQRAQDILAALPREDCGYLFVGPRRNAPLYKMTLGRLLARLGEATTVHGFRSSFRDWASDNTTFANHIVEMALAHAVNGVEAAYRRGDLLDKRRTMMLAWAAYCGAR